MGRTIGIDLGTTNSCVATFEDGRAQVIPAPDGNRTCPSVVSFDDAEEQPLVGALARRNSGSDPMRTVASVKRIIGLRMNEAPADLGALSVPLVGGAGNAIRMQIGDRLVSPEEVSAHILRYLHAYAEESLGEEVSDVVITVPAYFNDAQRQATKDAGRIAGLNVLRIINEPTAAALAYGLGSKHTGERVLVFDLGGGTFDVSILEIDEDVFEVKATSGNNHLGGDDFDKVIVDWIAEKVIAAEGTDPRIIPEQLQRMYESAEQIKKELSGRTHTTVDIRFLCVNYEGKPVHFREKLERSEFEQLAAHLVERTTKPVMQALSDAGLKPADIDHVILVGGMTRMPLIQKRLSEIIGKAPEKTVNPDEAVAMGAAIQAANLSGQADTDILLIDVTPLSLGIETTDGLMTTLIKRNTTFPTTAAKMFSTGYDNQTTVEVHVLQGERPLAADNRSLGKFILENIPPAPKGDPQIEVRFNIDADGIITARAKDLHTKREEAVRIQGASNLEQDELDSIINRAHASQEQDAERLKLAQAQHLTDNVLQSTRLLLRQYGDRLPTEITAALADGMAHLKSQSESADTDAIEEALSSLSTELEAALGHLR